MQFTPFQVALTNTGVGAENTLRFVVKKDGFPFELTENLLTGCRLSGRFTDQDGKQYEMDVIITANEIRPDTTVLVFQCPAYLERKVYFPTSSELALSAK